MEAITTIGLDIAKSVFQVHGIDAEGNVILRRQLKRRYVLTFFQKLPPCLVGIEACASSHHWSRELQALGHTVRLMPPAYVKPYVKRHKNDATDAEAIRVGERGSENGRARKTANASISSSTATVTHSAKKTRSGRRRRNRPGPLRNPYVDEKPFSPRVRQWHARPKPNISSASTSKPHSEWSQLWIRPQRVGP